MRSGHSRTRGTGRRWPWRPRKRGPAENPVEREGRAKRLPIERAAKRWIVSANPEEQVEKIRPYIELGFNHLVFHAPGPDQERFIRLYAAHVLPRLRAEFRCREPR